MLAYALSGGGNRGALQVGAVDALLHQNLAPQMVVGASIGAVNAAFIAHNPTAEGVRDLARLWCSVQTEMIYPGGRRAMVWNLLRGRASLFPNNGWFQFLVNNTQFRKFKDLKLPCYIIAADLDTGAPYVFGENPNDSVIDAIMASTALPPYHPPWEINGRYYMDGGAVINFPVRVAADRGADKIIGLNLLNELQPLGKMASALAVANQAVSSLIQRTVAQEIEYLQMSGKVKLRTITLKPEQKVDITDFSKSQDMVAHGRRFTEKLLELEPFQLEGWLGRLKNKIVASWPTFLGRKSTQTG